MSETAFFVGGPVHGTLRQVPEAPQVYTFTTMEQPPNSGPWDASVPTGEVRYDRQPDRVDDAFIYHHRPS